MTPVFCLNSAPIILAALPIQSESGEVFPKPVGVILDLPLCSRNAEELPASLRNRRRLSAHTDNKGELDAIEEIQVRQVWPAE